MQQVFSLYPKNYVNISQMKKTIGIIVLIFFITLGSTVAKEIMKSNAYKTQLENSSETYVAGCVSQGASETQCNCSYRKLIEKYGLEEYRRLVSQVETSRRDPNTMEVSFQSQEAKEFVSYMINEIPKLCNE